MKSDHLRADHAAPAHHLSAAIERIGGKWKGLILYMLMTRGPLRFNDLRRCFPKITHRVLTLQLRDLEHAGLVNREVQMSTQMRVIYGLTPYGKALHPVISALEAWGAQGADSLSQGRREPQSDRRAISRKEFILTE